MKNNIKSVRVLSVAAGIVLFVSSGVWADDLNNAGYYKYSGQAVLEAGEYDQAAEYFRKAYELESDWRILYDIARCEAKAKRYGVALSTYKEYLTLSSGNLDSQHAEEVKNEIQRLEYEVGYLEIKVPGHLVVMVDGIKRGRGPHLTDIPVTAGVEHEVTTKKTAPRKVVVKFGRTETVNLEEDPDKYSPEEVEEEREISKESPRKKDNSRSSAKLETAGWVFFATGAAELLGSAVTGALAKKKEDELQGACPQSECDAKLAGTLDARDNLALTTDILWISGAAFAVTGIVLLVVDSKKEKKGRRASLDGVISPSTASAVFKWEF